MTYWFVTGKNFPNDFSTLFVDCAAFLHQNVVKITAPSNHVWILKYLLVEKSHKTSLIQQSQGVTFLCSDWWILTHFVFGSPLVPT